MPLRGAGLPPSPAQLGPPYDLRGGSQLTLQVMPAGAITRVNGKQARSRQRGAFDPAGQRTGVVPNPPSSTVRRRPAAAATPGEQDPTRAAKRSRQHRSCWNPCPAARHRAGDAGLLPACKAPGRGRFWRASRAEGRQDPAPASPRGQEPPPGSRLFPAARARCRPDQPRGERPRMSQ